MLLHPEALSDIKHCPNTYSKNLEAKYWDLADIYRQQSL